MRLFLDSNVVIDGLVDRNDAHVQAKLLLALGSIGEFDLWVSPTQWTDLFYILTEGGKRSRAAMVTALLQELRQGVRISTMGEREIDSAMALGWADVEDAVVYEVARVMKPEAFITANKKDFERSELPVFTVEEFFAWLKEEKGVFYAELHMG